MAQKFDAETRKLGLQLLRELLPVGATVFTVLLSVSRDGMSRKISALIPLQHERRGTLYIRSLDWNIARAGIFRLSRDERGLSVGGAGMDAGFHLVYTLSRELFPDGFECTGDRDTCHSNDHSNGAPYSRGAHHSDGGYALSQTWL